MLLSILKLIKSVFRFKKTRKQSKNLSIFHSFNKHKILNKMSQWEDSSLIFMSESNNDSKLLKFKGHFGLQIVDSSTNNRDLLETCLNTYSILVRYLLEPY